MSEAAKHEENQSCPCPPVAWCQKQIEKASHEANYTDWENYHALMKFWEGRSEK